MADMTSSNYALNDLIVFIRKNCKGNVFFVNHSNKLALIIGKTTVKKVTKGWYEVRHKNPRPTLTGWETTTQSPCLSSKWRCLDSLLKELQLHQKVSPDRMFRQYRSEDIRGEPEHIYYRLEPREIAVFFWFSLATTDFSRQVDEAVSYTHLTLPTILLV